jgi:hypothetical protein
LITTLYTKGKIEMPHILNVTVLEIETNKKIGEPLTEYNFKDNVVFGKYDFETVIYALLKLEEAKYVSVKFGWEDGHMLRTY